MPNSSINKLLRKLYGLPLIFIFLGFFLRIWNSYSALFSSDEALHMTRAVSVSRGIIDFLTLNNPGVALKNIFLPILQHNHPATEFLILIPAVPFQPRELSARLVYIILSTLFLPFIYIVLSRIKGYTYALYFLGLLSTSVFAIWWSRTINHDVLAIMQGTLIGVAIIYFINKPSNKSFLYLCLLLVGGLLIFIDFIYYIPVILVLAYKYKSSLTKNFVIKTLIISFIILSVYYIPYIIYGFLPTSSKSTGFNHYLYANGRLIKDNNLINILIGIPEQFNLSITHFFNQSGVFPAWIFAFLSIIYLRKKIKYISTFAVVIFIYFLINLIFPTTLFYFKDFYGLLLLLSAEWFYNKKKYGKLFFAGTIVINIFGTIPIFQGVHNGVFNVYYENDKLDKIGLYAKNCLTGDESYTSTGDPWRTNYYFGREQLPSLNSGITQTTKDIAEKYLQGKYQNEVFLIHFKEGYLDSKMIKNLRKVAKKEIIVGTDHAFLFKECDFDL